MKVDKELIDKIANLAKLEFDNQSIEKIKNDLEKILNFVNKLNEIETENIEPLIYINEEVNNLRDDDIQPSIHQEDALKNAPHKDSDYFKIPTVLKKS